MNANEYKKRLIQLVQINKHKVFEDDESRKEFIKDTFAVDSLKKLDIDDLKLLLDLCRGKISYIPKKALTNKQHRKIYALWYSKARDKSVEALEFFCKRFAKNKSKKLQELSVFEAQKCIIALEKME